MLNHTYTSVKNANLVDCGKKQHISSQPISLLKDNFLGEFRTDLEKKKVLANLGIATELSLEWQYIKGDIGGNQALMQELDSRTTYITQIGEFKDKVISIIEGIQYLETIIKGEQEGEDKQNERLTELENKFKQLADGLDSINKQLKDSIEIDIETLKQDLEEISKQIANINDLIQISSKANNALVLIPEDSDQLVEGETSGLYVPNLEPRVEASEKRFEPIETNIESIQSEIESVKNNYVTKESLGGEGDFNFVKQTEYDSYINQTNTTIGDIQTELNKTVKTGEDGHVDTLYVNKISKNNDEGHIQIEDSFEVTKGIPLDIRAVVETLEDLLALPVNKCYSGMGVIVNSLSALYILRKPEREVIFNQEYISNIYNWKCPEDLVTVALTKDEYDALEEINPNVFYYIYEEEITFTQEPKRENYSTEEEFLIAWEEWKNSFKVLSQEYMSASWGIDIENKLSTKASADDIDNKIKKITDEINNIKGNGDGPSIESLGNSITDLQNTSDAIISRLDNIITINDEGIESGRLVTVESELLQVKDDLNNYVSKDDLQDASQEFIFVKTSDYETDKSNFLETLSTSIESKEITTNSLVSDSINTSNILLNESNITTDADRIIVNDDKLVAYTSDLIKVEVIPQETYDVLEQENKINEDTYYYTYGDNDILATKSDLQKAIDRIVILEDKVAKLEAQIKTLLPQE